jgi:hypothetical protein
VLFRIDDLEQDRDSRVKRLGLAFGKIGTGLEGDPVDAGNLNSELSGAPCI